MKSLFWQLMLLCFAFQSCSGNPEENNQTASPKGQDASLTDTLPFPVYGKFADLEPLLHRSNDTTYIVNFWATWCKPCVAEMPYFEQLHEAYKDKPVQVLFVSMDFPKQYKTKLLPFIQERNLKAPVVALADMDYNAWIDKVSSEWDGAIPFTLIYNATQRIVKVGEMEGYEELEGMVKRVIK